MYTRGQRITVPDPDGNGRLAAVFLAAGDPSEAIEVEMAGSKIMRDAAWVQYQEGDREGLTGKHAYHEIQPR